jgi:transketolase
MRKSFMEQLTAGVVSGRPIMLITGDLGWGVVEEFAKRFPNNFINAGVAEQNMMGMAAGMAAEGYHVFVYSIGNFSTFRCAEQIRNDVDYHNLPVTVVSVGGGLAYGAMGYSHHTVQDYALMRSMPNMLIAAPCDDNETSACMRYLIECPQPSYLRLGRGGEPEIHKDIPLVWPGKWVRVDKEVDDSDRTIVTTGTAASIATRIYPYAKQYTIPLWGMKYKAMQLEQSDHKNIISIEDHLEDGGFGSWLKEADCYVNIKALDHKVCGMVGTTEEMLKAGGL